jgi:hypothetical protein
MRHLILLLATMCFSTWIQAAADPQWLKEARAREGKRIAPAEIRSSDQWFTARVPAKLVGAIEKSEGSYTVELDLGAPSSAYCEVVPDGMDMAESLRTTIDAIMKQVGTDQGKVEARELERIDAGAFGSAPYLLTNWIYNVRQEGEVRTGAVKQIALEHPDVGVYCFHIEIGYEKTFENVARAFADTLQLATPTVKPFYREITTWAVNGKTVGVGAVTLDKDADGDTHCEMDVSTLFPGAALSSMDMVRREWTRPDHSLINAVHVMSQSGEMVAHLKLDPQDGFWEVSGTEKGKEVTVPLKAGLEPKTWLYQALELRKQLASAKPEGTEVTLPMWHGDAPLSLLDTRTTVTGRLGDQYKARIQFGAQSMDLLLNKDGSTHSGEHVMPGAKVTFQRVYVQGAY